MAKRTGLAGQAKRPDDGAAAKAAEVAAKLAAKDGQDDDPDYQGEAETVSYHLPVEMIELIRDLAEERLKVDRREKRAARRRGEKPPQARRSASGVVREALDAHRPVMEAELAELRAKGA